MWPGQRHACLRQRSAFCRCARHYRTWGEKLCGHAATDSWPSTLGRDDPRSGSKGRHCFPRFGKRRMDSVCSAISSRRSCCNHGRGSTSGHRSETRARYPYGPRSIHLVSQHVGVAIVTKPASAGLSVEGVVIRPLSDPSLSFETCLIMRSDDDSRLANEFGRSFLGRYAPQRMPPKQMEFWLSA
jgi:hypothetical protein